jgi:hypothetical protein
MTAPQPIAYFSTIADFKAGKALAGAVGGSTRRRDVVADESTDHGLELVESSETAFEEVAGPVRFSTAFHSTETSPALRRRRQSRASE